MHQHSNWFAQNGTGSLKSLEARETGIAGAATAMPDASKAAIQHLAMELQSERSLNRLGQRLNAFVSAALAAADEPAETTIAQAGGQLAQILVDELSIGLVGGCALVQCTDPVDSIPPSDGSTEQGFTVCAITLRQSSPVREAPCPSLPDALMPLMLGQTLSLGQRLSDRDLQRWQAQFPMCVWQLRRGGSVVGWFLLTSVPAVQPGALSSLEPSTARLRTRLIEQSLDRYLSALCQVELIQTQARQRQELVACNRELKQANQLKSEFLANTSHEIRTPLSAILGFTHLMREQGFSPSRLRHQEYLNIILSSGQHLLALINDILDLSKIEANQLDLHWETVAVQPVCQMAMTLVKEKANDKGLSLTLELAPEVKTLVADALRLKQMLFNLLSNALKFTVKGSVGLQVTAIADMIHFTIWDTGTGISNEQQQQLFRPYSQLVNTVTRRDEGTGLGLALTQKLAELHGGRVEVSSELGHGSRFTIVLPLVPPALETDQTNATDLNEVEPSQRELAPVEPAYAVASLVTEVLPSTGNRALRAVESSVTDHAKTIARVPTRSNHLLLVEDNFYNAKLMLAYLSKLGYELTWVKDGTEMRQALERALPALILMDINLPGEDGLTLTYQLKADERYHAIPIIAQTAMAMAGDRDLCLAAGIVAYVSKPIDLTALAQLISQYVKQLKD